MIKSLLISLLLVSSSIAIAKPVVYDSFKVDSVIRVYDGDTLFVSVKNYPAIVGDHMPIRIFGIDTPEIRGAKCPKEKTMAYIAKTAVIDTLLNASVIRVINPIRGKYFRVVGAVIADGQSIGTMLIQKGLAVPYFGGTKVKDWCD